MTQPKLFLATKGLVVHDGKVLILREAEAYVDGANIGKYDFPGGRLEPGEHYSDALEREVLEETGLSIKIGIPITVREWRPTVRGEEWQVVAMFFLCHATSSDVRLSKDHDVYEWINPREYEKYSLISNLKSVFEEYLKITKKF